jgi:NAD(P)-dependent dehydrogenase (short-subunit alcohol dehydrogenase family)
MKAEQLFNVRGHTVLVTGAASGLGLAIAEVLAANGAVVAMLDSDGPRLQAAVTRLQAAGGDVRAVVLDVTDSERLRHAIDEFAGSLGRLDAVFANAGISAGPGFAIRPEGGLDGVGLDAWQRVLDINLTSVLVTVQAAARHMKAARSGRIIVTASIAGLRAERTVGYAYAATKAAVANLVRQAAVELAPFNVLVNAIAPGPFLTQIAGGQLHRPEVQARFAALVPLGRVADPQEIQGLALLLASPASSFITGTVIPVDGGATAA